MKIGGPNTYKRLPLNFFRFALFASVLIPAVAFASEAGGGEHGELYLGIPSMVWFSIVNFALFVALLVFLLRKPFARFLSGRKEEVAKDMENARELLEQAEKRHEEVSVRLDKIEREMAESRKRLAEEGKAEGARIVEQARKAAQRLERDADFQADQEVKMARLALRREAADLAVKLAGKLLKEYVTDKDRDRLVNEFINEVRSE